MFKIAGNELLREQTAFHLPSSILPPARQEGEQHRSLAQVAFGFKQSPEPNDIGLNDPLHDALHEFKQMRRLTRALPDCFLGRERTCHFSKGGAYNRVSRPLTPKAGQRLHKVTTKNCGLQRICQVTDIARKRTAWPALGH
jgi:hypothetical protein